MYRGLDNEVRDWGYEMPSAERLLDVLFAAEPIEWNRIGAFQDVTMRLIAEQLLREVLDVGLGELLQIVY